MPPEGSSKTRRTRQATVLPKSTLGAPGRALKLEDFELFVLTGPDRGRHLPLSGSAATVGYAANNQVRLSDESVSGRHLSLEETPGGILLKDLGSTNGTRVDVVPVVEAYLKPGNDITLGDTVLRFQPKRT